MSISLTIQFGSIEEARSALERLSGTSSIVTTAIPLNSGDDEADDSGELVNVAGQVDAEGLPWDERIHSSNKKKTAKGVWTRRRGVADDYFDQIAASLRAPHLNIPTTLPVPTVPQITAVVPPAQPMPFAQPLPPAQPVNLPPANNNELAHIPAFIANQAQPPAAPAPQPGLPPVQTMTQDFGTLFQRIQNLVTTGKADANYILSITQRLSQQFSVQVSSINDISGRQDMINFAFQLLAGDGK